MKRTYQLIRGQSTVEFAIILPIFLTIMFVIFQFGLFFHDQLAVNEGAREGARLAAVDNDITAADIHARILSTAPTLAERPLTITTTLSDQNDVVGPKRIVGGYVQVKLEVTPRITIPYLHEYNLPAIITGEVKMRVEQ